MESQQLEKLKHSVRLIFSYEKATKRKKLKKQVKKLEKKPVKE